MRVKDLLDDVMFELEFMENSDGWRAQRPVILRKLKTAADLLDEDFRDRLRFVPNVLLEIAQTGTYDEPESITTYKVPEDCDPQHIDALSTEWSGLWHPLPQGISQAMRDDAYQASPTYIAWDVIECGEIEVWPHPDASAHRLRISYYRNTNDYSTEEGCVDMDSTLLNLMTLDQCVPKYGNKSRDEIASINRKLNRHIGNIRAKQLQNKRFSKVDRRFRIDGSPDAADRIYLYPDHRGIT